MSDTTIRDQIINLVNSKNPDNVQKALKMAMEITDPWFKCQSLAFVARKTTEKTQKRKILDQAFQSAQQAGDANRIVTAASWPIKVLSEFESPEITLQQINKFLDIIKTESNPVSKLDALESLIYALHHGSFEIINPIVIEFMNTAKNCNSWKKDKSLLNVAILIKKHKPSLSIHLIELIDKESKRTKAQQDLKNFSLCRDFEYSIDYRYTGK